MFVSYWTQQACHILLELEMIIKFLPLNCVEWSCGDTPHPQKYNTALFHQLSDCYGTVWENNDIDKFLWHFH